MNKEEIRDILNKPVVNFNYAVATLTKYFLEEPVRSMMLNQVVTSAKNKPGFNTVDLFSFFYHYGKDVVKNTRFSTTEYSNQMLLKSVWENAHILPLVILQIRQGYKIRVVTKEDKEAAKIAKRKKQLKQQAANMRATKARKRAERLAKENEGKVVDKDVPIKPSVQKVVPNDVQPAKSNNEKKYTKEQLEQIEMLRKMSA